MNTFVASHAMFLYEVLGCLIGCYVAAVLIGYRSFTRLPGHLRVALLGTMVVPVFGGLAYAVVLITRNVRRPPEWDLLIFWVVSRIAWLRADFYDPRLASALAQPYHPSAGFVAEALKTPFLYPPPTILWFMPFGGLNFQCFTFAWQITHFTCLVVAVFLLWKTFVPEQSARGLLLVSMLIMLLPGTYANIMTGQTVFLILLPLIYFLRNRDSLFGGIALGLSMLVKPFLIVFVGYDILRKKFVSPVCGSAVVFLASLVTFSLFGSIVFRNYLLNTPYGSLPMSVLMAMANQSLLAWVVRLTLGSGAELPLYLGLSTGLVVITGWRIWTLSATQFKSWELALILSLALLIYPGTLKSYSVLLIIPILVLNEAKRTTPIALGYALMVFSHGDYIFLGTLLLWTELAFLPPQTTTFVSGMLKSGAKVRSV